MAFIDSVCLYSAVSNLMSVLQEIHAGITLKPVNTSHESAIKPRNEMMAQIRQGTNLKPVSFSADLPSFVEKLA